MIETKRQAKDRHRWAHIYLAVIIVFAVVQLGQSILWFHQRNQLHSQVIQVKRALCLRKAEEVRQVKQGKAFLRAHPNGTPDFSRKLILHSIHDNQVVIDSLQDVSCS